MKPNVKQSKTTQHKRSRRPRRRVHRGRLAIVLTALAAIVLTCVTLLSRFGDGAGDSFRAGGDFRPPIPEAIAAGKADAEKVALTSPGSMQRQQALLFIHSRHSRMLQAGYNHAADDYISSVNDFLRSHGVIE